MPSNRERVKEALRASVLCDDCLAVKAGIQPRQTVYQQCKELALAGHIQRQRGQCQKCQKYKLVSSPGEGSSESVEASAPPSQAQPWYWEGHVQQRIVEHLQKRGCKIARASDTSVREAGIDIEATAPNGQYLWVTVKGWPEKSVNTQARHWFAQALFDIIRYRGRSTDVDLAIALPDGFSTYLNLAPQVRWFKEAARCAFFWVSEDGSVREE